MSSKAVNDLYQLSGQGTFEKLFELSVGLKRLYRSENIFDKDIMKNLSFAVENNCKTFSGEGMQFKGIF